MIDYKSVLNEQQYDAATTINGPLLIIAGAGAGKTATLIHRVAYMIDNGVSPSNILLLTFTNKAADEMKTRASDLLDERCRKITACTYHSFCANMLRRYHKSIGLGKEFTIIPETDMVCTIKLVIAKNPGKYKIKGGLRANEIAKFFSMSINKEIPLYDLLANQLGPGNEYLAALYCDLKDDYDAYKEEKGLLDYDDLLVYFNLLLDNAAVRNEISDNYRYIMVDEYQDTNNLQDNIVYKLADKYGNIAVVGDDYQSIYAFRGSNIENFIDFPKKYPGCKVVKLEKNYRSTTEILNLANEVMNVHADFGYKKNMNSNNKNGVIPELRHVNNDYKEAEDIINSIKKLHAAGTSYNDIAVLERQSKESNALEVMLTNNNIPYCKVGGPKFFERRAVLDILGFLRVIANPYDSLAWFRILQLVYGIGDTYANKIVEHVIEEDFLLTQYPTRAFHPKMEDYYHKIKDIRTEYLAGRLSVLDIVEEVQKFYIKQRKDYIASGKLSALEKEDAEANLKNDIKTAEEFHDLVKNSNRHRKLSAFLDDLTLGSGNTDNKADGVVTISTIHSAKGLEWKHVFILDCINAVYPGLKAADMSPDEKREALRVFYVAITRAKESIVLYVPEVYNNMTVYLTYFLKYLPYGKFQTVQIGDLK